MNDAAKCATLKVADDAAWENCDKVSQAKASRAAAKVALAAEKMRRKNEAKMLEQKERESTSTVLEENKGKLKLPKTEFDRLKALMAAMPKSAAKKPTRAANVNLDKVCGDISCGDTFEAPIAESEACETTAAPSAQETHAQPSLQSFANLTCVEPKAVPMVSVKTGSDQLRPGSGGLFGSQHPRHLFARKPRASSCSRAQATSEEPDWCIVDWSGSGTVGLATVLLHQKPNPAHLAACAKAETLVPLSTLRQLTREHAPKFCEQKPYRRNEVVKRNRSCSARPSKVLQSRGR